MGLTSEGDLPFSRRRLYWLLGYKKENFMTKKPFPALCKDCKYSLPEKGSEGKNLCINPKVVSRDPWALANNFEGKPNGKHCRAERDSAWFFAPCGMRGKLWEAR